jgi:transcriptional regulator with XRE-family HTH domain
MESLRIAAGLTQQQLATKVGVSRRSLYEWENGLSLPRADRVVELARALNVPIQTVCESLGINVENLPQ